MTCLCPPVIFPMVHFLGGTLFQGSTSHQEASFLFPVQGRGCEVCFWRGLFSVCPLHGCYRNNGHVTCFLRWGVREISPVLTVFHLGSGRGKGILLHWLTRVS